MEQIILWWAIDWWLGEQDYASADIFTLDSMKVPKYTWFDSRREARQGTSECVLFAIMGCVTDNTGYDFSLDDMAILRKMLPNYWRTVKRGMYTAKGWDLMVDFFKTKWLTLIKNSVSTYSPTYFDLLHAGWSLTFGSDISKAYIEDIQADGDIDILFGWSTGHLRRLIYNKTNDNFYEVENFLGSLKYNTPEITDLMLRDQIANKTLHYTSFYFYFLDNPPMMPKHNTWTTPDDKEIVLAWEKIINEWYVPKAYTVYTDDRYIEKMLIDIAIHRLKLA